MEVAFEEKAEAKAMRGPNSRQKVLPLPLGLERFSGGGSSLEELPFPKADDSIRSLVRSKVSARSHSNLSRSVSPHL